MSTQGPANRVLVTGASGFVGRAVIRELVARGFEPACFVRDPRRFREHLPDSLMERCTFITGDLFDVSALEQALQSCVATIHLVGLIFEHPGRGQTFDRVHVEGTGSVLRACIAAGVKRYLHMSALGTGPRAVSRYHQTKWLAETVVRQSPLDWTILKPSLIHGPDGEFMQMMKFFCTRRLRQPVMPYFGRGTNLLQPISVEDVASCFVGALGRPETIGQTYELGGPDRLTWKELYDVCAEVFVGRRRLKMPVPVPIARLLARTIVPLTPAVLMPYKFNLDQVQMSQVDNICDPATVERVFGITPRGFRDDLTRYADPIR